MQVAALAEICLAGQKSLAGLAGVARIVTEGQAERIGVGKFPAEIPRKGDVAEIVVGTLAVG